MTQNFSTYAPPSTQILDELRMQGDPVADQLIQHIFESKEAKVLNQVMRQLQCNKDVYTCQLPANIQAFFQEQSELPSWADMTLLAQGSIFFKEYAHQLTAMLSFLSLPYTYAAASGVKVLYLTKRINHDTARRLHETARYLIDITAPNAFLPEGKGIVGSLKVRLMHAAVRYHVGQNKQWDMAWGVPVNQEDMIGTNLSFSTLPLLGLHKMQYYLKQRDMKAYLHLWKVAGKFLGNATDFLPNRYNAGVTLGNIIGERHFKISKEGRELTQALVTYLEKSIVRQFPKDFVTTYMRFLLGDEIADTLDIPRYNWTRVLVRSFQANNVFKSLSPLPSQAGEKFLKQAEYMLQKDPVDFSIPLAI